MNDGHHRVIRDPAYGYMRLEPIPDEGESAKFYESRYYDLIRAGGRAPELRRFMAGGKEADDERGWLHFTLYSDIVHALRLQSMNGRVLDVGCGTGEFLSYLRDRGLECVGIEPSLEAAEVAASRGFTVYGQTLEAYHEAHRSRDLEPFGAVVLLNVLEHVPHPAEVLELARNCLAPDGIVCIRVPNDFSELQLAAKRKLGSDEWWIAIPDHINYFNFDSVRLLLGHLGFEVIRCQGDFPMEEFLLMGDDYVRSSDVGRICHAKRVSFEMQIPEDLRRRMYEKMAEVGVGRNCLVFGQVRRQ